MYTRNNFLERFQKTHHFVERQKERCVCDQLICRALRQIIPGPNYCWVIISKETVRKWSRSLGLKGSPSLSLILVTDGNKLVTCYYSRLLAGSMPKNHQLILIQS